MASPTFENAGWAEYTYEIYDYDTQQNSKVSLMAYDKDKYELKAKE